MPEARRTLVKSPPELWAEVSDPDCLSKHLEPFGEIRITRVEPETTVAWEGDRARGTVELSGSGWGTKVTLRAEPVAVEAEPALQQPLAAETQVEEEPRRPGFFARLLRRRKRAPVEIVAQPEPEAAVEPQPEPERIADEEAATVLDGVLDTLGAAHHRPFSR